MGFRQARNTSTIKSIYETKHVARLVKPTDTLYTDPLSGKALEFFWKYPSQSKIINFEGKESDEIAPHSFVLVDKFRLDWLKVNVSMWLTKDYGYHEPKFVGKPPGGWKIVWRSQHATLYRVE
jgi:hypothetical protein